MKKKILLIKGGHSKGGVGEHFVKAMLSDYPKESLFRFSLIEPNNEIDEISKSAYQFLKINVAKQTSLPIAASTNYIHFKRYKLPVIVNEIEEVIEKHQIEAIWIVLNSIQLITIFAELVKKLKQPIYSQVWDTPEYLCKLGRLDTFSKKNLLSLFEKSIKLSKTVITISDNLGKMYREKYGVQTQTMVFNAPVDEFLSPLQNLTKDKINIIFAGSLYAVKEWKSFVNAIASWNLENPQQKIEVTCIGNQSRWAVKPSWIKFEPTKPIEEVIKIINKADIAYLPYWMSKEHEHTVKTAFPSKLSLYAASGVPVFYHGPLESTPTYFLKDYKIGLCCHSYNKTDILNTIQTILSKEFKEDFLINHKRAIEQVFNPKASTQLFNAVLQEA